MVISLDFRLLFDTTYLPELASSALFSLVPGFLESQAVENLGPLAKETTFAVASVVLALVLGLIPLALQRFRLMPKGRVAAAAVFLVSAYAVMLVLGVIFLSLTQVSTQPVSLGSLAVDALPPGVAFAAALGVAILSRPQTAAALYPTEKPKPGSFNKRRRFFIKAGIGTAVAATILYYGVGILFSKQQSSLTTSQEGSQVLAAQVTPNSDFYRVDINVIAPSVDSSAWSLAVHGLVNSPLTMNYDQLKALPSIEEYATLECVSNKIGGDLMSTALWKGVPLKSLLDTAGVSPQADYVVFKCYDGYDVGIPLDRAMAAGTILAYEMNGVPLPTEHGFPVRAIVPGLYGMMNAKWITEISLVSGAYEGFWQRRGWTNIATYQTGSTTITPGDSALRDRFPIPAILTQLTGSTIPLVGVAFAGDRGVQKVEVSADGGNTWEVASLQDPLSSYTWVFWKLDWNPSGSGSYRLMVRATDGTGQVQVASFSDPYPNGATGYQVVDVDVS